MVLKEVFPDTHTETLLGSGDMTLYADRLECCGQVFPLAELTGFSLVQAQTVDLTCAGRSFEIRSGEVRCTRKYMTVIEHLKQSH